MAKAAKGKFKCSKCDRTFSMAAHLARHTSTMHVSKAKKEAAKRKAAKRRKAARRTGKRVGRPKGVAALLKLKSMTLEQLGQLLTAVRAEARRKLTELSRALS